MCPLGISISATLLSLLTVTGDKACFNREIFYEMASKSVSSKQQQGKGDNLLDAIGIKPAKVIFLCNYMKHSLQ